MENSILFRGTSLGWPGNFVPRNEGFTPTTVDPLVAAIFAAECAHFGIPVILTCRRADVADRIGPPNVLADIEREVVIHVAPLEFAAQFATSQIDFQLAREVLRELGFEVPPVIASKGDLIQWLESSPRMADDQIVEFVARVNRRNVL